MILFKHELRRNRVSLLVWTAAIGLLMVICLMLFPEMKQQMAGVSSIFASMGSFTAAFGMDRLNFGELTGFYAIECGNVMGLGGAFFASLIAVNALSREEHDLTAEFLLSHPVSRRRVVAEKLCAVVAQIFILNAVVLALSIATVAAVGEAIPWKELLLLHLGYFLLQLVLAGVCFGVSAFLRRGAAGVGLGVAAMLYFLNLAANISSKARFLKYISPFGFCEGADIVGSGAIDGGLLALGLLYGAAGVAIAFVHYCRKDIH